MLVKQALETKEWDLSASGRFNKEVQHLAVRLNLVSCCFSAIIPRNCKLNKAAHALAALECVLKGLIFWTLFQTVFS
jgi:hypothetical protein